MNSSDYVFEYDDRIAIQPIIERFSRQISLHADSFLEFPRVSIGSSDLNAHLRRIDSIL